MSQNEQESHLMIKRIFRVAELLADGSLEDEPHLVESHNHREKQEDAVSGYHDFR